MHDEYDHSDRPREYVQYDGPTEVAPGKPPRNQFALVLLKKKFYFSIGPLYYLEYRKDDDDYKGRIGLYGGALRDPTEPFEDCAVREVREETGLTLGPADLLPILDFTSHDWDGTVARGVVFLYEFHEGVREPRLQEMRAARDEERIREKAKGNGEQVGNPVTVTRYFNRWFIYGLDFRRFTPLAAHALIADYDRDIRLHSHRRRRRR